MKRKFKRIASLVLAAVMVFAMAVPAMATSPETEKFNGSDLSITVTNVASDDHTFTAYQIFKGKLNETAIDNVEGVKDGTAAAGTMLSNIEWGDDINTNGRTYLEAMALGAGKTATLSGVVEWLDSLNAEDLDAICKDLVKNGDLNVSAHTTSKGDLQTDKTYNYEISGLSTGYYLVVDSITPADPTVPSDAVSAYMVQLVYSKEVKTKTSVPQVDKTVTDKNDSDGTTVPDQKTADYDINDVIDFKLTGTIGQNFAEYESYYFAFHDVQSEGLTFNADSVVVNIDGTNLTKNTGYKVLTKDTVPPVSNDGCTFEIVFEDLKALTEATVKAGSVITVTYQSTLNNKAVIGNDGNSNNVTLEYSNNPNTPTEHGTTPPSTVIVFTFDITVNKVDDQTEPKPLKGAKFTLDKWVKNTDPETMATTPGNWVAAGELKIEEETVFNFEFVDDGIYKLTETETPDGFNTMTPNPIYIKVEATHDLDGNVKTLTATVGTCDDTNGAFTPYEAGKEPFTFTVNSLSANDGFGINGQAEADVVNRKGATLPETGGIGTTIFYVVGSVLVLGAVILLVTKRRMKSE